MNRISHSSPSSQADKPPIAGVRLFDRDGRKEIIRKIQQNTGRTLLCYVAQDEQIRPEDVIYTQELLYSLDPGTSIDLLLNSPGGDVDTAEKLVHMILQVTAPPDGEIPTGEFRLLVPDKAKSAGTLIALGADEIIMSNTSELGPIDPQVRLPDQNGNLHWHSVFDYIDAYEDAENKYRQNPTDPVFRATMDKFDPVLLRSLLRAKNRVRTCAENLLKRHGGNSTWAPSQLMDTEKFPSHGQMIDWETAKRDIRLNVNFVDGKDLIWRLYWELYCYLRIALEGHRKVFESADVSLVV